MRNICNRMFNTKNWILLFGCLLPVLLIVIPWLEVLKISGHYGTKTLEFVSQMDLSWIEDYGVNTYNNYDMTSLQLDEAYLVINHLPTSPKSYSIFRKHEECLKCAYVKIAQLDENSFKENKKTLILQNALENVYRISTNNQQYLKSTENYFCEFGQDFGEFGIYEVNVSSNSCGLYTVKEPAGILLPSLLVLFIYSAILLCGFGLLQVWKKINPQPTEKKEQSKRVISLDAFRGFCIGMTIFVYCGSGGYKISKSTDWNGVYIYELIFPCFTWIGGVCIPISLMSFEDKIPNSQILSKLFKRSVKLFFLGIFLGYETSLECVRILGVLQRHAICCFIVSAICVFVMSRNMTEPKGKSICTRYFIDILRMSKGWLVILIILCIYGILLISVADTGCPKGYLGPGGIHEDGKYFNCTGGASGFIDRLILGKHMFQPLPNHKSVNSVYLGEQAFDPEGILATLPAIVQVFIGAQAGMILLSYKEHHQRLIRFWIWSIVTGITGGLLCGFSKDDGLIPMNKQLWSISFVLVTSSLAFLFLSISYILIDAKRWWSGKPFLFVGMNATLMYVACVVGTGRPLVRWTLYSGKNHSTHTVALIEGLWGTSFWMFVAYYLYKIKFFLSL